MAIVLFKADPARAAEVALWQLRIDRAASVQHGFLGTRFASTTSDASSWAAAISFDREDRLRAWLASPERRALFDEARTAGVVVSFGPDLVLESDEHPPPGTAIVVHRVREGAEARFVELVHTMLTTESSFSGYEASAALGPGVVPGAWISVVQFGTDDELDAWLGSPEREALFAELSPLLADDLDIYRTSTAFGTLVRVEAGRAELTATWRTALLVLTMLYPTVMLLTRFLAPRLESAGAPLWLAVFIDNAVSVALLTWLLMPVATHAMGRWLDPVDGRRRRVTIVGCAAVALWLVSWFVLYASVPGLGSPG